MEVKAPAGSMTDRASKSKWAITVCLFLLILVFAVSFTMIGPMMPILINKYAIKWSQGGLISTFQSIGGILAFVFGGLLADKMKKTKLIGISFILYILSLLLISLAPVYLVLLCLFFILGLGTNLLDILANAYISDLHPERRGVVLNLLHTFFGVGAFIGPLFSSLLIEQGVHWNVVFRILGIVCGVLLVLFIIITYTMPVNTREGSQEDSKNVLKLFAIPKMWILGIIMLLYTAHQGGISTWLPTYMETSLKSTPLLSGMGLSVFWIGIILGRLACSKLTQRFSPKKLIIWGGLAGGIVLTLGLLTNSPMVLIITAGLSGLLSGAFIPLLITIGCGWYPQNSGAVSSILFLKFSISRMLFPWLMGIIAEVSNFRLGMLITSITLIISFFIALAIPE
ncbi:MAG TPA: MFS transporter [Clostridiales bacterium]|nr:MFS transporter [Clostridiales bacterium]